jgi:hypothetical protein
MLREMSSLNAGFRFTLNLIIILLSREYYIVWGQGQGQGPNREEQGYESKSI